MTCHVEVVGYTKFKGVPNKLAPIYNEVLDKNQDVGSDAARLIECAGRTCYDSYGKGRASELFHKHLREVGHGSVLEHASISFFISGISRGCSHELVRHRAGCAISQRSTRYVDESDNTWAHHPLLFQYINETEEEDVTSEPHDTSVMLDEVVKAADHAYINIVNRMEGWLVSRGVDKANARKQARGAARGCLGNALSTEMVWTANMRALRTVFEQRCSQFADAEIRLLANRLYEETILLCPEYFNDYEQHECPDGIGFELRTIYRKI